MSKLDITVTHSLGIAEASSRLQKLLLELEAKSVTTDNPVKLVEFTWIAAGSTANFELVAHGTTTIKGRLTIAPAYVHLETDPISGLPIVTMPLVWYYSRVIRGKLNEVLK